MFSSEIRKRVPDVSLKTLALLCFLTILLSQANIRFTNDAYHEAGQDVFGSKEYKLLWTRAEGNAIRYVLSTVVVVTAPLTSLAATALLIYGCHTVNPYYFLPWMVLTAKALVTIQLGNVVHLFHNMLVYPYIAFGMNLGFLKWCTLFFSIILLNDHLVYSSYIYYGSERRYESFVKAFQNESQR